MSKITASILIIGNEILSGRSQEINVQFIAKELSKIGIAVKEVRIVPDISKEIIRNVNNLRRKYNYLFTTGGIGPTHDDITSECVSKAFSQKYVINKEAYKILEKYYSKENFNVGRIKMTKMPEKASLILNPLTVAPGFYLENVFVLPGVPKIMQAMFFNIVKILEYGEPIIFKTINTNLYESIFALSLAKIQNKYNDCEIGSYPTFASKKKFGGVNIVVTGTNKENINNAIKEINNIIISLGGKTNN